MTPERTKKIKEVMSHRQSSLAVVLENVDDVHNVGAILRSCDAFGVGEVHLLYTINKAPRNRDLRTKSAASASKWLKITKWDSVAKLTAYLKKKKMTIAVTRLVDSSVDPVDVDLRKPIAIVIGNEKDGVSEAMAKKATLNLKIPMVGFVQSFNVSVAAALLLYEAFRQRQKKTPPRRVRRNGVKR